MKFLHFNEVYLWIETYYRKRIFFHIPAKLIKSGLSFWFLKVKIHEN